MALICPGCAAEMETLALDGQLGTSVEIDLCRACHAIWFDRFENLRLAPRSIVKLFQIIANPGAAGTRLPQTMTCPRCRTALLFTHDMQHATRFEYWRCDQNHGHFITFLNFLREKDFIRPLTADQTAALRDSVRTVNCSNCGGPIDLAAGTVCPHCGSPLTMLDMQHVADVLAGYKAADAPQPIDPALPLLLEREKRDTERRFDALTGGRPGETLVEAGIRAILDWMGK